MRNRRSSIVNRQSSIYEVELKFPLDDFERIVSQIERLHAERGEPVEQRDLYFAHPQRDFAKTDEALRLRSVGRRNCTTYKGPIVDSQTKTRREIEILLAEGETAAAEFRELMLLLGFREVRTVVKTRVPFHLEWEGRRVELALDDVVGLGTFLEMEIITDEAGRDAARDSILRLADRLGLDNAQRKSYLCLLLERDRQ